MGQCQHGGQGKCPQPVSGSSRALSWTSLPRFPSLWFKKRDLASPTPDRPTLRPSLILEPLIFNKLWRCSKPSQVPLTCPKLWSPEKKNEMHHPSSFCCLSHCRPSPAPAPDCGSNLGFQKENSCSYSFVTSCIPQNRVLNCIPQNRVLKP